MKNSKCKWNKSNKKVIYFKTKINRSKIKVLNNPVKNRFIFQYEKVYLVLTMKTLNPF